MKSETYFFIHYIEADEPPTPNEECIPLNHAGFLYIGSAYWEPGYALEANTFFCIEDARRALAQIAKALGANYS